MLILCGNPPPKAAGPFARRFLPHHALHARILRVGPSCGFGDHRGDVLVLLSKREITLGLLIEGFGPPTNSKKGPVVEIFGACL